MVGLGHLVESGTGAGAEPRQGRRGGGEPGSMSGPGTPDAGEQADLVRKFRSFGSV